MSKSLLPLLLRVLFSCCLFLLAGVVRPVQAQDGPVPRLEEAELIFEQGLEAFEAGDYGMAYRRFRLLYSAYDLNRKTTAAQLMAGRALYQDGQYEEAIEQLEAFVRQYPSSSYVDEAEQTIAHAQQRQELVQEEAQTLSLGVALPLSGEGQLTQALFNGIRLAVAEHNQTAPEHPVRMVFRDTENAPSAARQAVASLADEAVDAIIGPLYSSEAEAAAAAAEQAGVVLVPPLATEDAITEGRDYVFQVNPNWTMRGRLMARFAIQSLRLESFAIAAELNDVYSERMAEGFQDEALQLEAEPVYFTLLDDARGWANLPEAIGEERLNEVEALYLPVTGSRAEQLIRAALTGLDQVRPDVRILGNAEWHGLNTRMQASNYNATYSNDFRVEASAPAVQDFVRRYRALTGQEPQNERLTYTGYDVARYLIQQMAAHPDRPLREVLRQAPAYEGLGIRIDFRGGNVNEAMHFHRYRMGNVDQLR